MDTIFEEHALKLEILIKEVSFHGPLPARVSFSLATGIPPNMQKPKP